MSPAVERCPICGLPHHHLQVCPFVAETEVREEYVPDGRRRRLIARIVRTRYYRRDQLFEALVEAQGEPDGQAEVEAEGAQP